MADAKADVDVDVDVDADVAFFTAEAGACAGVVERKPMGPGTRMGAEEGAACSSWDRRAGMRVWA